MTPVIELMNNLVQVHEELLNISKEKSDRIKEGDMDKMQAILVKERKQIRLLEQTEKKRQELVDAWFLSHFPSSEEATITKMLEAMEQEQDKEILAGVTAKLTERITELKQQEELNRVLLSQSMQFVQLSLDLMRPSISNINYGSKNKENEEPNRSLFDSQA
ncbi:flagellar protein FlgN [Oceanobacillus piezotolerans]|uniref:flagellar protein FlgN n=1 Tax=Oceanobacillus piezotolerans TaxID=2448030 RepID=UPI001FECB6AF|nr:flagellar protein FlgN [Oceanobacillus piezotolerans]